MAALEAGQRVLNKGGLLGIYPEGTRSPDGLLYRGRTGVARMAAECDCPVIPVGLVGTREIMSKDQKVPNLRGAVTLRFGEPMSVSKSEVADEPMALRHFVDGLMYQIRHLSGQDYRDEYSGKRKKPEPVAA
jgi:1-acyl-sn-glycerol-3-phosphate acyltransferase